MALIVKLFVNEREIASYSAVRRIGSPDVPALPCRYELQDGARLDHYYDDGAEALAVKVLLHQMASKKRKS